MHSSIPLVLVRDARRHHFWSPGSQMAFAVSVRMSPGPPVPFLGLRGTCKRDQALQPVPRAAKISVIELDTKAYHSVHQLHLAHLPKRVSPSLFYPHAIVPRSHLAQPWRSAWFSAILNRETAHPGTSSPSGQACH
jgi:hypothetical protein